MLGGEGRRGARLGSHGNDVARKVDGLEAVLVDRTPMRVGALAEDDPREFDVHVAGPTALLLAKLCKIHERSDDVRDGRTRMRSMSFACCGPLK
jgi:hypothetical protein